MIMLSACILCFYSKSKMGKNAFGKHMKINCPSLTAVFHVYQHWALPNWPGQHH